jgi:hypothetical protein
VGFAGGRVLDERGWIRSGAYLLLRELHVLGEGLSGDDPGYAYRSRVASDVSAVAQGCFAGRAELLREGLDFGRFGGLASVDLCLRARARGFRVVYNPWASFHSGPAGSAGLSGPLFAAATPKQVQALHAQWPQAFGRDPYYSPRLSQDEPFELSFIIP